LAPAKKGEMKMLDKLIESETNAGTTNRRLSGFLLSTLTVISAVLMVGLIYSLFSYNLAAAAADDNLEISTLLAPIKNLEPEPPKSVLEQNRQPTQKTISDLPTRQQIIQRPEETPVDTPTTVSVTPQAQQSRPKGDFKIGPDDSNPLNSGENERGNGSENPIGIINSPRTETTSQINETEVEPAIKQTKKINPPTPTKTLVSKGVVNGHAKNLVKPAYPQPAKLVGASGEVKVQVTIDEEGRVISAVAVSGHSLLKPAAVSAARLSTFTPTLLSDQKVKVTGIIIYNFTR
jgi:TonB family protein